MLVELHVRNFAVIEESVLQFEPGFSVLSGESGVGKSVLVEALGVLVGGRPSARMVRAGKARARIEARFTVEKAGEVVGILDDAGIDVEDGWLILTRELRREGRHRAWVNGRPATTRLLKRLGACLIDLHGQHDHQRLLSPANQRRILDAYAGASDLAGQVRAHHEGLRRLRDELAGLRESARETRRRAGYLRFKLEEIEAAGIRVGEEEELELDHGRLSNSEELLELSSRLHDDLYERDGSILEQLGEQKRAVERLVAIDGRCAPLTDHLDMALNSVAELGRELSQYKDGIEHDPRRLEQIRTRQTELYRLKTKYGATISEVLHEAEQAEQELATMDGAADEIARLEAAVECKSADLAEAARELSGARREAGVRLGEASSSLFPQLGLGSGHVIVEFRDYDEIHPDGAEGVEFLTTLNPGFPPEPLRRIASGGELSRIMLALETVLVTVDPLPVLAFDEVDAGVGGEVAHGVANHLVRLSAAHQVLVVTHLAQVAARADAHYEIRKYEEDSVAVVNVHRLDDAGRVYEVARMLGGDPSSATSRAHAKEMLARHMVATEST